MNKQTGNILLLVLLAAFIFIIAVGGYFLLNNKASTSLKKQEAPETQGNQISEPSSSEDKTSEAINILETIPEIKTIQQSVVKAGRKPFFTPEGENGDIVTVSLRESFSDDPHTSRIDTFNVNIISKEITVSDVVTSKDMSLEEWKKTVKERFPSS